MTGLDVSRMFCSVVFYTAAALVLFIAPAFADCVNPAGKEGRVIYNVTYKVPQYCDGTKWFKMSGGMIGTISLLGDVDVTGVTDGACLIYNNGSGKWEDGTCGLGTETDPEVGTLTASKWCAANAGGTAIDCTQDTPSGGDDLGDHTATQNLDLAANDIVNGGTINAADAVLTNSIQIGNDAASCTAAKDGAVRYRTGNDPPWEYCDGGTTSWLPFKQPRCQDDGTGECYLDATRSNDDPNFVAANIASGVNILGVTGTLSGGGAPDCSNDDTVLCTLDPTRSNSDPDLIAANIVCGVNILGVVGTGDSPPDAFSFIDLTGQATNTLIASNSINISGLDPACPASVSVSGQGSPEININGGGWVTSGTIADGQSLQLRLMSAATQNTMFSATVTVGTVNDQWDVTTTAIDDTPDAFSFTDVTGQATGTLITSNSVNITGITGSVSVSVTGDGSPQIRINGGSWVTSGTITNGQSLEVQLTSSASFATLSSATVTVGTGSDQWDVTTLAQDTTPDAFSFTDVTGQATGTLITSNSVNITGITGSVSVSVTGDGSPKIRINGGSWVTSGTITNSQSLEVQLTSSSSNGTILSAMVTVGTASDQWDVKTIDDTPDAFSFTDLTAQASGVQITSNSININGIAGAVNVSVTGGGSPQISINGGAWVTSGTIQNGQSLQVRLTSDSSYATMTSATVTVGTGSDQWDVTTGGCVGTLWGDVPEGYSNTAYSNATPSGTCASVAQTRTCTNNVMSGSYTNLSCLNGCARPWGGYIKSGQSLTAYQASSVACGSTCTSETRNCTDGSLSGSYTNFSCSASCTWVYDGITCTHSSCGGFCFEGDPCSSPGSECRAYSGSCGMTSTRCDVYVCQ